MVEAHILAYQIISYIYMASCTPGLTVSLLASVKNKFSDWSPHFNIFCFLLGNIFTTLSFVIGWYFPEEKIYELPVYFTGEALSLTSWLLTCNKLNYQANQRARIFNPFYAPRVGSASERRFLI